MIQHSNQNMINKRLFLFLLLLAFGFGTSLAQQTRTLPDCAGQFRQAETLFELEKYASARPLFEAISDPGSGAEPLLKVQAAYYAALCAAELESRDAEYLLDKFIFEHNESSMRSQALFRLGVLQFNKRNYRNALRSFGEVDQRLLSNRELAELYFKKGFCYLRYDESQKARQNFNQLRGTQTAYTTPATYYYAHLSYLGGDYAAALQDFEKIKNECEYRNVIPHYIVHIHYKQEQYDQVISNGAPMFNSERTRPNLEIARMLGDAHYRLGNYSEAVNYLEFYHNNNRRQPNREESYQLAYLYFLNGQYTDAIRYFQPATSAEDSLSQYAYYHLAGAYLEIGQKQYAGNAFYSAYRLPFNQQIREDALFNYAKLSLEISINPYNESLRALSQYLEDFPDGQRREEALTYMVHLYLTTNNYREALASIENIRVRDDRLKEAYQKITYYRGVELFNDRDFFNAIAMFRRSQESPIDPGINIHSIYWTGEAYYRLSQYDLSLTYFNRFLNAPGARTMPLYYMAHYNIGYSYFQQKRYTDAIQSFNRFLVNEARENRRMVSDAYLRIGDSYFINKNYQNAIQQYDKAIRTGAGEADYATFQKALAQGALGNQQGKIASLRAFERQFSSSPYAAEAFYEMGNTAMIINQNSDALSFFNTLIRNYQASSLARTALMKTGLIYYNTSDNTRALETFKNVVKSYPGTPEAHEALANIRNIYVDMNRVDEFINYSRDLPFAQITDREQDSLIYIAALNKYMENDCSSAILGFSNYLGRYPQGFYSTNAHFYKADCEFRTNRTVDALRSFEAVIERPQSEFTERSLQRAARINQNMNNHARAYGQFAQLEEITTNPAVRIEAISGQLHTGHQLDDHNAMISAAEKLIGDDRVPESALAEINLLAAKAANALQQEAKAMEWFRQAISLSPHGSFGAEASFHVASILFKQRDFSEAENTIFDLAENYASYDYWVASGFILLADIYRETGNIYQARQTLLSVIENYQGEDLKEVASKKLNELPEMGSN
jgi:TolA-binding protein